MYFAFIDESGKPNPKDNDKRPVLNAVCVKDTNIKKITQQLYNAELTSFGEAAEENRKLKGKKMINRRAITKYNFRKEYVEKIIDIMETFELFVFAVVMERPDFKPYEQKGLLPMQYRFLLERLNFFGEDKYNQVLLVYDKIDEKEDGFIADGVKNFLFKHEKGKEFQNIIHMPLFVSSINNPLIRFPDLTGNILRVFYSLELDKKDSQSNYESWIKYLADKILSRTINVKNCRGSIDFGIYQMKKELFPQNKNELDQKN